MGQAQHNSSKLERKVERWAIVEPHLDPGQIRQKWHTRSQPLLPSQVHALPLLQQSLNRTESHQRSISVSL